MKITFLHTRLAPYYVSCLRELVSRGHELLVIARPQDPNAPFDSSAFSGIGQVLDRSGLSREAILEQVKEFQPDAVVVAGWADKAYLKVCQELRKEGVFVIAGLDTQWKGSLRQYVACMLSPWYLHRSIDVMWAAGERQKHFARALGYTGDACWDGIYACDWDRFAGGIGGRRLKEGRRSVGVNGGGDCDVRAVAERSFLFVGRYAPEKGIDVLIEAYEIYKKKVKQPWKIVCAGAGPLRKSLLDAGIEDRGFVQPAELPDLMASATAFVLPSQFEPWGVVVQEAAASGLPLICSDACGAGVHLLRDHWNGYTFPKGDAEALADRMVKISELPDEARGQFEARSLELSKQYTPERWVDVLLNGVVGV